MHRHFGTIACGYLLVVAACRDQAGPLGPAPARVPALASSAAVVPTQYAVSLDVQTSYALAVNRFGTAVGVNSAGNAGGFLSGESIGGLTPGPGCALAEDINDSDTVVGTDCVLGPWVSTAFGPASPLAPPPGGASGGGSGGARAISNNGFIVGHWYINSVGSRRPVVWDASGSPVVYDDLDPVDDCFAVGQGISPDGANVAGWSEVGCQSGGVSQHAVLWTNGNPTDLFRGSGNDVTNSGIVIGTAAGPYHAMAWDGGNAIDINPAGLCVESAGVAIVESTSGDVLAAGYCTTGTGLSTQTFGIVWSRNAGWAPIAILDVFSAVLHDAVVTDISPSGVIVGYAKDRVGREYAVAWDLGNRAPTVSVAGPIVGTEGVALQLTATATDPDGDALVFDWDFGDGSPHGSGATVGHTYAVAGTYALTVTATDPRLLSGRASTTATISPAGGVNVPPVADAGGPYAGVEGTSIQLDGSQSFDPDNSPLGISFEWDFGDGSATSSATSPSHTYQDNGTYSVILRVADFNDTTTATVQVTVGNVAPTGVLVAPSSVVQGTPFSMSLVSLVDPSPIDLASLTFEFDCATGAFGPAQSSPTVSCTNANVGTLPVQIRVTDKDGGASTYAQAFSVRNAAPVVRILGARRVVLPVGGTLNITGGFADAGTNDAPWQGTVTWGAGQGNTQLGSVLPRTPLTASHVYNQAGRFEVWLTVVDRHGGVGRNAIVVVVQ